MIQQPNQNLFTGIFAEDGNYIGGYVMVWHCDEFALIPDLSFGIDTIAPTHDFEKLINNAVIRTMSTPSCASSSGTDSTWAA